MSDDKKRRIEKEVSKKKDRKRRIEKEGSKKKIEKKTEKGSEKA